MKKAERILGWRPHTDMESLVKKVTLEIECRIALLLSGQPRFVKEVAPIIIANVIGDYNVDTFCHFWFDDKLQK